MERIPVSLWLKSSSPVLYFCMRCRTGLNIKLEGEPKNMIVGIDAAKIEDNYRPLTFPIRIKCYGKHEIYGRCMMEYIIQGFIEGEDDKQ